MNLCVNEFKFVSPINLSWINFLLFQPQKLNGGKVGNFLLPNLHMGEIQEN